MGRRTANLAWAYCRTCNEYKGMSWQQRGCKYYFRKWCVECYSALKADGKKQWAAENVEYLKEYHARKYARNIKNAKIVQKRYYDKWKKVVFDHYGNECECCGEQESKFLTLDHKNDDGAQHRKNVGVGSILFRWLVKNKFPKNFRILCFNCNSGRFHNGGMCPHETKTYQPSNWIV